MLITTKGQKMNTTTRKWCLLKESDGERGESGKFKVYEITVTGCTLHCSWGMAEKANRQTSTRVFMTAQAASAAAFEKRYQKLAKGYTLAYAV